LSTVPEGRYGKRPARRTPLARALLVAAALAVGIAVAFLAYRNLGDNRMRFTFDVSRDEPERAAVCVVRVREVTGAETGRREVLVPPGGSPLRVETVITGSAEPVTADVFGCSYQVPDYLSSKERPTE
jgi:hypothetical protein